MINTYVSLIYGLKRNGKVFTSKFVGTGPSSYEKRIYRAVVSQRFRNIALQDNAKQDFRPQWMREPLMTLPMMVTKMGSNV